MSSKDTAASGSGSTSIPPPASAYHNVDRASVRVMAQAAYQPTDEEYAELERRAEARKAAKADKAAAKAAAKADKKAGAADKATTDDASSVFSFGSLASTTGLLRKSDKEKK